MEKNTSNNQQKESLKETIKEFLDGSILTRQAVVRQLPFIFFLTLLAIVYIANRFHAEKIARQTTQVQNDLRDLRSESISIASELMTRSNQTEIVKQIKEKGLDLNVGSEPPKKVIQRKEEK